MKKAILCAVLGICIGWAGFREVRRNIDFSGNNFQRESSGWVSGFSMIGVRPYISFGFNPTGR